MQQLRGQVKSLQTTVQLTFDLQLEIQRAIRQEVSAGLARGLMGTGRLLITLYDNVCTALIWSRLVLLLVFVAYTRSKVSFLISK